MSLNTLVLDNVVLSSFYECDWFNYLWFWYPEYQILAPLSIWKNEFRDKHDVRKVPKWLRTPNPTVEVNADDKGQLSEQDWECVGLTEETSGILVTRDRPLKERADGRGLETMWSSEFLIETFKRCGIPKKEYERNISQYISNAYLPSRVSDTLRHAKK